jgi:hypothetical protein
MNGSRRMRDLARLAAVAVLAAVPLAGCGSDDSSSKAPSAPSSSGASGETGAGGANQALPSGSLTQQEYRLFHGAYTEADRANKEPGAKKGLAHVRKACSIMDRGTTPLTQTSARDCQASYEFFVEILAFPKKARQCDEPGQEISSTSRQQVNYNPSRRTSGTSCASEPLQALAAKTRTAVERSKKTNRALDERKIRGRCRIAIGTPQRDLRNGSRIATTAEEFDHALEDGGPSAVRQATKNFQDALTTFSEGPDTDLLKLLRSCRH